MSLSKYWAYYTGAPALKVVARKKMLSEIANIQAPKGRAKTVSAVILGKKYRALQYPISTDELLDSLTETQALNAAKGLPICDPSGCSWRELWQAYKERYKQ